AGQSLSDAASTIRRSHVETAHSERARNGGFKRQSTDRGEQSVRIGGKQGLALAIEAYFAGRPVGSKRLQHAIAFLARFPPHGVEAGGQVADHPREREAALRYFAALYLLPER